jgi:PAS domain S-box-containing protein
MSKRRGEATEKKKRPTIGLLMTRFEREFHRASWSGIADAALERDVNLICFDGGILRTPEGFAAQGNVLYDLVSSETIDGLIIWSSILDWAVESEEMEAFCKGFRPLPVVSVGREMEGVPSILVDNYQGMREDVAHLVEVHGYRRIAFIRGPKGSQEENLRYRAYADVLAEHDIPLDSKLVTPHSGWERVDGHAMVRLLLDERKADFDAVVAANDSLALGALEGLQAQGVHVPQEVGVVGFDDVEETRATILSLTTVRQPLDEVGKKAVEEVLAMIEGKQVPEQAIVPLQLMVRRSCGCQSPAVVEAAAALERRSAVKKSWSDVLAAKRKSVLADMAQVTEALSGRVAPGEVEQFLDSFIAEMEGRSPGIFLATWGDALRRVAAAGGSASAWQGILSTLRRHMLPYLDGESLFRAENLWHQARVLVEETAVQARAYASFQSGQRDRVLREIDQLLITSPAIGELSDVITQELPRLGIPSCYLSLYQEPEKPTGRARLILAYDEKGRIKFEEGGRLFPSAQLVPGGVLPQERRYHMMVEPLYFRENQLGFALFEVSQQDVSIYDVLRGQISGALQGARLLEDQRRAEETLMEERNLLRTLIDNLPEYIFAKDAEGRFAVGNMALARHMGAATPGDLIGKTDFDFYPQKLAAQFYADEQALFQSGQSILDHEEATRDSAGNPRWTLTTKVLLHDSQGKVTGLVGVSREITERKQAEAERERLLADLERHALQLQTAAEVSRAASSILDLDALIQQVVNLIRERFDLYYAGLFLVDEAGEWAVLRAGTGEAGQQMIAQGHKLEAGGASMIGTCVASKQARIALDVGEEAVRFENPLLPETRSELALPLVSRGEVIGALTIQSSQEAAFSDEDVAVLQTMADQLANAIANARLYRALAREQYLMRALMENVPDYIYFKDDESRFIMTTDAHLKTFGLSDPARIIGKTDFDFFSEEHARQAYEDEQGIIRTGEPILGIEERETWPDRPDTWVLTSKMPLRDEAGGIVGTFGISRDITLLKQAELALQRRALQLQTAAEVSRAASSILDPDELIRRVVDLVRERFELYYVGLFLVDEAGEWAVLRAGTGEAGRQMLEQGHRLEVGGGSMIGGCVTAKAARIALDVGEEAVRFENPLLPETRSELALPLISRGEAIGALTIQSAQEAAFSDEDVAILQTMADQLANAIANTRLFDQAHARAEEMSILSELAQTLSTRLTVQEVLEEVYRGVSHLLDATNFYIALYDPDSREITFPLDTTQEEEDRFRSLPADEGITGYIIRHRTSVLIEENVPERLAEMGIKMVGEPALSWLGVPMMVGDQVLGVMAVQSFTTPRAYDEHDRDLLVSLATQVASVVTNVRLFEQTQAALAEVEATQRRYLERVWSEYTQTQGASGYAQTDVGLVPLGDAVVPEVQQAMKEQHTIVLEEGDGSSVLVVPVSLRGQPLGAVGFKIEEEGRRWTADDIALVEGVGEQFALAAENIRLLDETQRRAARERLTRDITDKMRRAASVDDIVQTAVDELFGALKTSRTFVRLGVTPSPQDDGSDKEES